MRSMSNRMEEEKEAAQQDSPCCRSSLSSRWEVRGGAGGHGRGPAAWCRVDDGCPGSGNSHGDLELRGAAARNSVSFPGSGSFPVSRFFPSGSQSIGASAPPSVLPVNIQDSFPLGLTGLISWQSKGLASVFSSTMI